MGFSSALTVRNIDSLIPYNGNHQERIEDYGHELGGLELSHIAEVPINGSRRICL